MPPAALHPPERNIQPPRPFQVVGHNVRVLLSQSSATRVVRRNRIIYLPAALISLLQGTFRHAPAIWPKITIRNGRVLSLACIAEAIGVSDGAAFVLELDLHESTYLVHNSSAILQPTTPRPVISTPADALSLSFAE